MPRLGLKSLRLCTLDDEPRQGHFIFWHRNVKWPPVRARASYSPFRASQVRNIFWSGLEYVVAPASSLIATPIFIRQLGLEQYGILTLASAIVGMNAIFSLGFADTTLKFVSAHMGSGARERAAAITRTIGFLSLASGLATGLLVALTLPLSMRVLGLRDITHASESLLVVAGIMPLRLMESVYIAVLRGCYRYDVAGAISILVRLATILVQVGLALGGHDVPTLLMVTLVCVACGNFLLIATCWWSLGDISPRISRSDLAQVSHYSVWSWVQGIAGLIYANIDRLLITALLGPTALGVYGACMQLAQNIHYGLAASAHSLFAYVSMISAQSVGEDLTPQDIIRNSYRRVSRYLSVAAAGTGALMAVFAWEILELWINADFADEGAPILSVLAIAFGWFAANSIAVYYTLNGLGFVRLQAGVSLAGAAVMALSAVILVPVYGLSGAAFARLPDALLRLGIRIYVARSIIKGLSEWMPFDFLRITAIALLAGFAARAVLRLGIPSENILRVPVGVIMVILLWPTVLATSYQLEEWLSIKLVAPRGVTN